MDGGQPSNVLFVVLDTVRKDHLGPYGYERPTTPSLDAFASEATVFESAVAPAPWTLPVHASMFTGRYPSEHGADQASPYLDGTTTLATALSAAGYDTACYSSNAWITPYTGLTDGFDEHDAFFEAIPRSLLSGPLARAWKAVNDSDRLRGLANRIVHLGAKLHATFASGDGADSKTPAVIDRAVSFVDDSDADAGWFAFVNLMDAHLPYYPPADQRERFAPGVDPDDVCQNSKEFNAGVRDVDDEEWTAIRGLYDAEIAHADAELGRLFEHLRETGQWEDTTVIVCADHGELHGEHDLYGHEFALYDQLVNVPLLVKHPGLEADRRSDLVELLDLYHTVLDATDVDPAALDAVGPVAGAGADATVDEPGSTSTDEMDSTGPTLDGTTGSDDGGATASEDAGTAATDGQPGDANAADGPRAFDPTRSLLAADYREFEPPASDPGQRALLEREADADYAFVEYEKPLVELHHLEEKAAEAGVELPDDHRAYARLRAARSTDAKYVRADRIPDEAYRLDGDPGESTPVDPGADATVAAAEAALSSFESAVGGAWDAPTGDAAPDADDVIADVDEDTADRLRELGYLE